MAQGPFVLEMSRSRPSLKTILSCTDPGDDRLSSPETKRATKASYKHLAWFGLKSLVFGLVFAVFLYWIGPIGGPEQRGALFRWAYMVPGVVAILCVFIGFVVLLYSVFRMIRLPAYDTPQKCVKRVL